MTSSTSRKTPAATCPACDRFIGPADVCPYCDTDSARSPLLRLLRWASLLLAIGGLVSLYLMAVSTEVEPLKIGAITPAMNFANVRISGRVERDTFVGTDGADGVTNYLAFYVNDGTGRIRVQAYRDVARTLCEKGRVPRRGTRVEVTGPIRVATDKKIRVHLKSEEHLRIGEEVSASSLGRAPRADDSGSAMRNGRR